MKEILEVITFIYSLFALVVSIYGIIDLVPELEGFGRVVVCFGFIMIAIISVIAILYVLGVIK